MLNLLGRIDELSSLANYSYNNPDYVFPQVTDKEPVIDALGMGHPLLKREIRDNSGTGLIATHDISLDEMETEYPGIVVNKCFEIEIDGESISFDYLLRDGITRKMNAAALMRQMGIA